MAFKVWNKDSKKEKEVDVTFKISLTDVGSLILEASEDEGKSWFSVLLIDRHDHNCYFFDTGRASIPLIKGKDGRWIVSGNCARF